MQRSNPAMPTIFVLESELEQLMTLVDGHLSDRFPLEAEALRSELDRAVVLRVDHASHAMVTLHSEVEYLDVSSGRRSRVTVVLPWEADPAEGRISVLAPLGTALFGLRVADSITWQTPSGRVHTWQVLEVRSPATW